MIDVSRGKLADETTEWAGLRPSCLDDDGGAAEEDGVDLAGEGLNRQMTADSDAAHPSVRESHRVSSEHHSVHYISTWLTN